MMTFAENPREGSFLITTSSRKLQACACRSPFGFDPDQVEQDESETTYGLRPPRSAPTWCARWDVRRACAVGRHSLD